LIKKAPIVQRYKERTLNQLRRSAEVARDTSDREEHFDGEGRLIKNVEIKTNTSKTIYHNLSRPIRGWEAKAMRASAAIDKGVPRETSRKEDTIVLFNDSTVDIKFDLWVY